MVVLAAMAMSAPAAQLTFPPSPGVHCHGSGCHLPGRAHPQRGGRAGGLARPGAPLPATSEPSQSQRYRPVDPRDPAIRVHVVYQLLARWARRHFDAQIVITARHQLGHWNMALRIPGAQIQFVLGAKWQAGAHPDTGIAYGTPWPWARSSDNTARIIVFGTGSPRRPVGCWFDAHRCTFTIERQASQLALAAGAGAVG
jgi:hypothetical protein